MSNYTEMLESYLIDDEAIEFINTMESYINDLLCEVALESDMNSESDNSAEVSSKFKSAMDKIKQGKSKKNKKLIDEGTKELEEANRELNEGINSAKTPEEKKKWSKAAKIAVAVIATIATIVGGVATGKAIKKNLGNSNSNPKKISGFVSKFTSKLKRSKSTNGNLEFDTFEPDSFDFDTVKVDTFEPDTISLDSDLDLAEEGIFSNIFKKKDKGNTYNKSYNNVISSINSNPQEKQILDVEVEFNKKAFEEYIKLRATMKNKITDKYSKYIKVASLENNSSPIQVSGNSIINNYYITKNYGNGNFAYFLSVKSMDDFNDSEGDFDDQLYFEMCNYLEKVLSKVLQQEINKTKNLKSLVSNVTIDKHSDEPSLVASINAVRQNSPLIGIFNKYES